MEFEFCCELFLSSLFPSSIVLISFFVSNQQCFQASCQNYHGFYKGLQDGRVADGATRANNRRRRGQQWQRRLSLGTWSRWGEVSGGGGKLEKIYNRLRSLNEKINILSTTFFFFLAFSHRLLAEEYYNLYKSSRVETLKALNENHQFEIAESVKLKILFSVVVVSWKRAKLIWELYQRENRESSMSF